MLYITIDNTGCGLGDMLNRIDVIFKFCKKYGHQFVMPLIASNLHNQNYDEILGLTSIRPRFNEWGGESILLKMEELEGKSNEITSNVLFSVRYNHEFSRGFIERHRLHEVEGFNYQPHVDLLKSHPKKDVDFLIHLRLGDNYIYKLPGLQYLDSGRRRILDSIEPIQNEYKLQWTVDQVEAAIERLEECGFSYKIHCDGIDSALRHVRWSKDPAYLARVELLSATIREFGEGFVERIASVNKNVHFGDPNIITPIFDLLRTKTLVYTTGGFMRSLNKFWSPTPAHSLHFSDLAAKIDL